MRWRDRNCSANRPRRDDDALQHPDVYPTALLADPKTSFVPLFNNNCSASRTNERLVMTEQLYVFSESVSRKGNQEDFAWQRSALLLRRCAGIWGSFAAPNSQPKV